jgi:hypothetical protein
MSAVDTSDCLGRELVNRAFILLQLQRGEIVGTLSCRDTQMNGVAGYLRREQN